MNATKGGFFAEALVLPGEEIDEYMYCLSEWAESLDAASPAEMQMAATIGDLAWRTRRLELAEHRREIELLDAALAETEGFKLLQNTREVTGLVVAMMDAIAPLATRVDPELDYKPLLAAIEATLRELDNVFAFVEAPVEAVEIAFRCLSDQVEGRVLPSAADFQELFEASEGLMKLLDEKIHMREEDLEALRVSMAGSRIFVDDRDLRKLTRYRATLAKSLKSQLELYEKTREVVQNGRPAPNSLANDAPPAFGSSTSAIVLPLPRSK